MASRSSASAYLSKRHEGVCDAAAMYRSGEVWVQQDSGVSWTWPLSTLPSVSTPRHSSSTNGYSWLRPSDEFGSPTTPPVGTAPCQDTCTSWRPRRFWVWETCRVTLLLLT